MKKVVLLYSIFSLSTTYTHARVDNFFIGNTGREIISGELLKEAPYKWIGRISMKGVNCTGSLVGKQLLLTASHCITKDDGELNEGTFKVKFPNFVQRSFSVSKDQLPHWFHGEKAPDWSSPRLKDFKNDWVIVKLDTPLPDDFGHFLLNSNEKLLFNQNNLTIAGYGRRTNLNILTKGSDCSIRLIKLGVLFHDCDSEKGDSGAPIFYQEEDVFDRTKLNYYIAGVNAGEFLLNEYHEMYRPVEYSFDTSNIASSSSEFLATWKKLKNLKTSEGNKKIEKDVYGRFVENFPSSVTGSICYLHCGANAPIPVSFKVPKSLGPIKNQTECTKRAVDYCKK